jgi:hypothetical protein
MKKGLIFAAALTLLSVPAFAQYGGGAQNSGGPAGSAARGMGVGSGGAAVTAPTKRKVVKHKRHPRKAVRRHSRM